MISGLPIPFFTFTSSVVYERESELTPAERFDGTPFTDRGFENVPALRHLEGWLEDLRKAA